MSKLFGFFLCLALTTSAGATDFTFAAFGDTPYSREEEERFPALVAELNRASPAFIIHVGDIKSARSRCSDQLFMQRREWFDLFHPPFVLLPGDNEWTDCRLSSAGSYAPLERLRKLRELFFSGDESLGQRRIVLARQSGYPEHARWRHDGVLFATLNVPGGANNARHDPDEFGQRSKAVLAWLRESFRLARDEKLPAIVIAMHANPWASPTGRYFGYRELLIALDREVRDYAGSVLLLHGDTHRYRFDRPAIHPDGGAAPANFSRLEVFGYPTMNWVRVRVREEAGRVSFAPLPGS